MQPQQRQQTNGAAGPATELELYQTVSTPTSEDTFLRQHNLGLGKYSDKEYWQQIQAFKIHLYAESAFERLISELTIYTTVWELGAEVIDENSRDAVEYAREKDLIGDAMVGRRHAIIAIGRNRFENLHLERYTRESMAESEASEDDYRKAAQLDAIREHSGTGPEWLDPHARMISARHEGSRSKDAHLIDNLFGRVHEQRRETDQIDEADEQKGGIL